MLEYKVHARRVDANGSLATRKVFVIEREWDCGP